MPRVLAVALALAAATVHAQSAPPAESFRGFSGLLDTPNALVLQDGNASLSLSNERDPRYLRSTNTTFFLALGFLPYLEVSGRFSEIRPGPRDLSGNAKLELPLFLLHRWLPAVGLGVTDLGSSVPYFRSKYGVLTETLPYARLSLGYGLGPDQLDGAFGGVELMPVSWASLLAEYDTREWNAGARLSVPVPWGDTGLRIEGMGKVALRSPSEHWAFSAGIQVPLSFHAQGCDDTELEPQPPARMPAQGPVAERMGTLADALVRIGFENVRVGSLTRGIAGGSPLPQAEGLQLQAKQVKVPQAQSQPPSTPESVFIEFENNVFNANDLDALGVVFGTAAQVLPDSVQTVVVQLRKDNLPLVELSAPLPALVGFFFGSDAAPSAPPLRFQVSHRITDDSRVTFVSARRNGTFLHSQFILSPKLTTLVGTEVGPFDAILALRPELLTRLWSGAAFDLRFAIPLLWTDNYSDGGPLRALRPAPQLENAVLFQTLRLAPGFFAMAGAGLFQSSGGGLGELSWMTPDGRHRLSVHAALTVPRDGVQTQSAVAAYRFYFTPLQLSAELAAGRFLNSDDGVRVTLGRDFGDTRVSFFYSHTSFQEVGIAIALPLTPRKDLRPGYAQLKGASRWHFRETTSVGHSGSNPIHLGLAQLAETGYTLEDDFLNGDRWGTGYLDTHLDRLRNAYSRWNLEALGEPRIDHP